MMQNPTGNSAWYESEKMSKVTSAAFCDETSCPFERMGFFFCMFDDNLSNIKI